MSGWFCFGSSSGFGGWRLPIPIPIPLQLSQDSQDRSRPGRPRLVYLVEPISSSLHIYTDHTAYM